MTGYTITPSFLAEFLLANCGQWLVQSVLISFFSTAAAALLSFLVSNMSLIQRWASVCFCSAGKSKQQQKIWIPVNWAVPFCLWY